MAARSAAAGAGGPALWAARGEGAGGGRMWAWRVHQYGAEPRLEAARVPALRAPDELLVKVHAASINPLDVAMIGGYGRTILNTLRGMERAHASEGVEFPLVVGRDFAGTVERCGAGAGRRRGARVFGVLPPHWPGAHQQYVVVKECWTGAWPERLGLSAGGALYAGLTACSALRAAGLPAGAGGARGGRVLLLGLGGVGHAALQLLAADGHEVVVGCDGSQAPRALELGAARALPRLAPDYGDQLVAAGPYEAIIDCAGLGGGEAGARAWRFKRYVTLTSPLLREADARGLAGGGGAAALHLVRQCWGAASGGGGGGGACPPPHVRWAYFMPSEGDIELLRRRAEKGQFSVQVERVFPWWEAGGALERARGGHARGKLLLDYTQPAPPGL